MTQAKSNVEILKNAYDIWHESKGGSIGHWLSIMADDIDFRSLAEGAAGLEFTSRRSSKADAEGYLRGLVDQLEMIHYTVDECIAEGDRVVAFGSTAWRNKVTGKTFDTPKVDVVRFRDGLITDFFELYDTAMVAATSEADVKAAIERCYEARRKEVVEDVLAFFDVDATFRVVASPALGELSQTLRGHDQIRAAFKDIFRTYDWTNYPIKEIVVEGDKVVVHSGGTMRHTPSGKVVEFETLDIMTMKDGKIIEFVEFLDTQVLHGLISGDG